MSQPARQLGDPPEANDSPEVAAFRKLVRGQPLTDAERALLATMRKPAPGPTVPHARIEEMLEERRRREQDDRALRGHLVRPRH